MRTASTRGGQCAFCAFRASERRSPPLQRQDGARRYGSKITATSGGSRTVYRPSVKASRSSHVSWQSETSRGQNLVSSNLPLKRPESAYNAFGELVETECIKLEQRLYKGPLDRVAAWGIASKYHLTKELDDFKTSVKSATERASSKRMISKDANPLFYHLRQAFITGHTPALAAELQFRFLTSVVKANGLSTESTTGLQKKLADLRFPVEWYPATRAMQRTIHLHVGPTNSGKTYHALKRLEAAKTGIYAGPLRLLAHEVYTRFNAMGKKCALITGEERRIPEGLDTIMNSCTVEMIPLNTAVDVAVIDEIQMLGDDDRGWAWTQAFL